MYCTGSLGANGIFDVIIPRGSGFEIGFLSRGDERDLIDLCL